jgi:hypothetical protein
MRYLAQDSHPDCRVEFLDATGKTRKFDTVSHDKDHSQRVSRAVQPRRFARCLLNEMFNDRHGDAGSPLFEGDCSWLFDA